MKKALILFVSVLLCFNAVGFGKPSNYAKALSVDQDWADVEITVPASSFSEEDFNNELTDEEKETGYKSVRLNDDGSKTYTMSKDDYDNFMDKTREELIASLDSFASDDYSSIKKVEYNDKFDEIKLTVDREDYEGGFDSFVCFIVGIVCMTYQMLSGIDADSLRVTITVQDEATNKVFSTIIYPDDMQN